MVRIFMLHRSQMVHIKDLRMTILGHMPVSVALVYHVLLLISVFSFVLDIFFCHALGAHVLR